jgi:hypothetical protein
MNTVRIHTNPVPESRYIMDYKIIIFYSFFQIFVTGGIGGVHRGAAHTMDISADLTELGR